MLENQNRKKDEDVYKLKQDNQQLFSDLKQMAQQEENSKTELLEARSQVQDLEMLNSD